MQVPGSPPNNGGPHSPCEHVPVLPLHAVVTFWHTQGPPSMLLHWCPFGHAPSHVGAVALPHGVGAVHVWSMHAQKPYPVSPHTRPAPHDFALQLPNVAVHGSTGAQTRPGAAFLMIVWWKLN